MKRKITESDAADEALNPLAEESHVDAPANALSKKETENEPVAPELPSRDAEEVTEWDTPASAAGDIVDRTEEEDEAQVGERLVEEGIETAEDDLRSAVEYEEPPEDEE